jgi:soluble lytic murein transglycosylase-like protein
MIVRQKLAVLGLCAAAVAHAQTPLQMPAPTPQASQTPTPQTAPQPPVPPATQTKVISSQQTARRAMEASVARQAEAVAAMQISIAKQRTALAAAAVESRQPETSDNFFTLSWPSLGGDCSPMTEPQIAPLIQQAAQKEGVTETLLRAVADRESGLRPCAVSSKGAMGLMQLMPGTAADLGVHDPFDPQESLMSGAHFLKQLLDRFGGDVSLALGAYNAGPARVEESGGVPQNPETIDYVKKILSKLPIP